MSEVLHIVIAMKPTEGGFAENALKHGVVGLNIDGGRVAGGWTRKATPGVTPYGSDKTWHGRVEGVHSTTEDIDRSADGRWPANVILGHAEGCVLKGTKKVKACGIGSKKGITGADAEGQSGHAYGAESRPVGVEMICYADADGNETVADWDCVEACPVRMLGEQSGETSSSVRKPSGKDDRGIPGFVMRRLDDKERGHDDAGTAARFFKQIKEYADETVGREQRQGC